MDAHSETVLGDFERGESPLSMKLASKHPLLGGPIDQATCYRYCERGLRGVKLEWAQLGNKRVTSLSAIKRFAERLTAAASGHPAPIGRTRRKREHELRQAEVRLAKAGL